ncbi:AAA family ATPase [Haliscomenobacter sp.]|uniref:AAA family ATPase n=1 Tax=Haliscomenobacter sp. TaxID=2717303 RepID=UPI003BA9D9CA
MHSPIQDISSLMAGFDRLGYVIEEELATVVYLSLKLGKPILVEGNPGIGKTELANMLARLLDTQLIRLQCYEGLDINSAVYEWNYQKQLLGIKIQEHSTLNEAEKEKNIFSEDYLLKRPLLQSISAKDKSPVLLIDEIDRTDEEFEAFLLELLSEFQITIPELGTIKAQHIPYVILTSNRTRELSDALKRRCLYHWVDYPSMEKELAIVYKRFPEIEQRLATQLVHFIQALRQKKLQKTPGVSETLDWALSLMTLGYQTLDVQAVARTYGCILKSTEDIKMLQEEGVESLLMA